MVRASASWVSSTHRPVVETFSSSACIIGIFTSTSHLTGVGVLLSVCVLLNSLARPHFETQVLQTAKDIGARQGALIDVFIRVQHCFKRLEIYTNIPATDAMRNIMVDIMVEVISFLAIATKEVKRGRASQSISGLIAVLD